MVKVSRYSKVFLGALFCILLLGLGMPLPAYAIADPDTPPSVNAVYVYEDLLADGDAGVLIDYYLDYTVNPTETASESFLGVFIDTDGTTQLKASSPYTYQDSGYGRGVIWIYFTPAEVTTYSIDSASVALYSVWLVGNPTLSWPGDPPKTTAGIDYWQPAGSSAATLLALRVLYYADILELAWTLDLIEETALGNRLTSLGAGYFTNAIPNLRLMAPACFSTGEYEPTLEDLDYSTEFGATAVNGTGTIAGSPVTLVEGSQSVNVTGLGTIIFTLTKGTVGTVTDDVGTVNGSPVDIVWGTNTVTATGMGNVTVDVNLVDTVTVIEDTVTGTGFDLTAAATAFGMTRWMFSGLIWFILSIVICAGVYQVSNQGQGIAGSGKIVMLVFNICVIGGAVLGLIHPLVAALMFIGFGALVGYMIFFRHANV